VSQPASRVAFGPRHLEIFTKLYREADAHGNLVPRCVPGGARDRIGHEWITTDGDYARVSGLRSRRLRSKLRV